ncbi:MAG: histidinol dehydrogenase [Candidatus Diapherotrites archaeon]
MIKLVKDKAAFLKKILERGKTKNALQIEETVKGIIEKVKKNKNKALIELTEKFDGVRLTKKELKVSEKEIENAVKEINSKQLNALKEAKKNIEKYAKKQKIKEFKEKKGKGFLGQIVMPIEKLGIYVPGGKYPLISTVLMCCIPSKVAGVKEIILCTPPQKSGEINSGILVAAKICGVTEIFKVGGAQAIAAMAFGTESIPKVNKIVGPGNVFVSTAKKILCGKVGIDFFAGPSEILIASNKGNPKFIASDLIAQAEHDELASAIMVTQNKELALKVKKEVKKQLKELNNETAKNSLKKYGAIVLVKTKKEAIELINSLAPEHLELMDEFEKEIEKVINAGSVFLGEYSAEVLGDYFTGPNHTLPTNQWSKFRGGLTVNDFLKVISVQKTGKKEFQRIAEKAMVLAEMEGLKGHRNSVQKRMEIERKKAKGKKSRGKND